MQALTAIFNSTTTKYREQIREYCMCKENVCQTLVPIIHMGALGHNVKCTSYSEKW